ncbi:hypothetical protein HMPREF9148_01036 [Prevotella sp. F0091]|nr:hypothetical protein HMPREF9148_01036 [Prevotella sp. F0091]
MLLCLFYILYFIFSDHPVSTFFWLLRVMNIELYLFTFPYR